MFQASPIHVNILFEFLTVTVDISKQCIKILLIAALFAMAGAWRQTRCPLANEWMGKLWCICTVKYCSAIKKNTFESVLMRLMKL